MVQDSSMISFSILVFMMFRRVLLSRNQNSILIAKTSFSFLFYFRKAWYLKRGPVVFGAIDYTYVWYQVVLNKHTIKYYILFYSLTDRHTNEWIVIARLCFRGKKKAFLLILRNRM